MARSITLGSCHPPQDFERFFRRLHALASAGRLAPKGLSQVVLVSMLFVEHEIRSVKPPHGLMRVRRGWGGCGG